MLKTKRVVRFFCLLALFYGLLDAPWPGLQERYSAAYRAAGNYLFGSFGSDGVVRFQPRPSGQVRVDTDVILARRDSNMGRAVTQTPRRLGYLPTAEVIALIVATPIPWARRCWALLWGLILVHAFIVLRMAITLLHHFEGDVPCSLYELSPFWSETLYGAYEIIVRSPDPSFLVPVFIWAVVSFRRNDWEALVRGWGRRRPFRRRQLNE